MPEYNEVLGTGARYEGNTQKTSDYNTTIDLDVENIDKMIRIHRGTSTMQLMKITLERLNYFPENLSIFVKIIQMSHKSIQLISQRKIWHWKKVYMRR